MSVTIPTDDSGDYLYQASDIASWRATVVYTNGGETYFLPSTTGASGVTTIGTAAISEQNLSTGSDINHGTYAIWAYGFDKAGTQIAFSGGTDNARVFVEVDYDETKRVTIPLQWGAQKEELLNKYVSFWDTNAGELIGEVVGVKGGTTFDTAKIPLVNGYTIECYKDSAMTVPFDFSQPIDYSVTVWSHVILKTYTVAFFDGTVEYTSQTISHGRTASEPTKPEKSGFVFVGWYADSQCTQKYDFATAVTSDRTLYVKWSNTASVTVTMERASADAGLSITSGGATFTATSGFASYLWKIDGETKQNGTSNTFTADTDALEAGWHTLTLAVRDVYGNRYSATAEIVVQR